MNGLLLTLLVLGIGSQQIHHHGALDPKPCSALDFLQLRDNRLKEQFFFHLDSILLIQYPKGKTDAPIPVDLSPELLDQFLKLINTDSLKANNYVEHKFHFNIARKGYSDKNQCFDIISVTFFPESCTFHMLIDNSYFVPDWGCTGSDVSYGFEIRDGRILNFARNEAG